VAGRVVQFSGGEPTIHPQFLEALSMAREMGFSHIQAATNGLKFTNLEFAQAAKEAGLHTLYLQFDGITDDVYLRTRGEALIEKKMRAIDNVRKAGMKICFVPTIVKGVNDHQIGDIRLRASTISMVSAISFQPVAFCGISRARNGGKALHAIRFRARHRSDGSGDPYNDWFPLSFIAPSRSSSARCAAGEPTTRPAPPPLHGTTVYRTARQGDTCQSLVRGRRPWCRTSTAGDGRTAKQRILWSESGLNSPGKHYHEDRALEAFFRSF
jgi:hypothetical protein